jgi:hypothetical protein
MFLPNRTVSRVIFDFVFALKAEMGKESVKVALRLASLDLG